MSLQRPKIPPLAVYYWVPPLYPVFSLRLALSGRLSFQVTDSYTPIKASESKQREQSPRRRRRFTPRALSGGRAGTKHPRPQVVCILLGTAIRGLDIRRHVLRSSNSDLRLRHSQSPKRHTCTTSYCHSTTHRQISQHEIIHPKPSLNEKKQAREGVATREADRAARGLFLPLLPH